MKRYLYALLFATSLVVTACEKDKNDVDTDITDEVIDFTKLSHYGSDSYPESDKWSIVDQVATTADFATLRAALTSVASQGRSIELKFTKLEEVPAEALCDADLAALTSLECSAATMVGSNAFQGASKLSSLELPKAVTIEDGAFEDATSLSSLTLYSAESLDGFAGCTALARVVAPKVTTVGEEAFRGNVMLTSITLESAQTIGASAFADCINLSVVELESATAIDAKAFAACGNIEELTIAQNSKLTQFGDESGDMFEGVSELLKVALTTGSANESMLDAESGTFDATSIGGALYGPFKSINSVTPTTSNVTLAELSAESFPLDANIWNITDSVATSDDFDGLCDAIEEVSDMGGRLITLRFPNLESLPDNALECYKDYAVRDFSALYRIELEVATSLGESSLMHCEWLVEVDMPKVEVVGRRAFAQCYLMESVTTPEVTELESYAFVDCISLVELSFPKVTSIGDSVLSTCRALKSVSFPLITSTSYKMFSACSALSSVDMPLLTTINSQSFDTCSSLQEVSFPEVTTLSSYAFANCSALVSVDLPKAKAIGSMSFQFCNALQEISLPAAKALDGAVFKSCTMLTTVSLPEVTEIGDSSPSAVVFGDFEGCSSLEEITLPKVVDVGTSSFKGCSSLQRVSLPAAVRFGSSLFASCTDLTSINIAEEAVIERFGDGNANMFTLGAKLEDVTLTVGYVNSSMVNKGTRLFEAPIGTSVPVTYGPFKSIEFTNEVVMEYNSLADYGVNNYPDSNVWDINDIDATFEDFAGLRAALGSLDPTENHITINFENLSAVPAETFKGLTALSSVSLSAATSIGDSAFESLIYLTSITAPLVQTLGDNALAGCSMLMNISLAECTTLGEGALSNCSSLFTIALPKAESLGARVFEGIAGSKALMMTLATESTLTQLGTSEANLFTPDNTQRISLIIGSYNSALYNTESLMVDASSLGGATYGPFMAINEVTQVVDFTKLKHFSAESYPTATTWVIDDATATYEDFAGLRDALTTISATFVSPGQPGTIIIEFTNLEALPASALFEADKSAGALHTIILDKATSVGEGALRNCTRLDTATLPMVETLEPNAFSDCSKLYSIEAPMLSTIKESALSGCSNIMSLILPNVTWVGNRAFDGLSFLMTLEIGVNAPITHFGDVDGYVFGNSPSLSWAKATLGAVNSALINTTDKTLDASSIGGGVYGPFSSITTK
ncbi:MAG: leucine-rich repeat protein [Rikenellaceae bacterium]